jgi:hypothetical protein
LGSEQAREENPTSVLQAIDELGKIARLRGISSTETMTVLADYLDVHKHSLLAPPKAESGVPAIIYQPHPVLPEAMFPAVVTFQHIGKPAIPILLTAVEKSESDSLKTKNAVFLLKYFSRDDPNEMADRLMAAANMSTTEKGRQRLLKVALLLRDQRP